MARAVVQITRMDKNAIFSAEGVVVQWQDLASHFKDNSTNGRLQYIKCQNCGRPTLLHKGGVGDQCTSTVRYSDEEVVLLMNKIWDNPVLSLWRQDHAQHVETPGREQGQVRSETTIIEPQLESWNRKPGGINYDFLSRVRL